MFILAKKMKQKVGLIVVFSMAVHIFICTAQQEVQTNSVFVDVKDLFNKSLINLGKDEESAVVDKKQNLQLKIQQPTHDKMKFIAMNLMVKHNEDLSKMKSSLDRTFLKKMEICCGEDDVTNSLARLLDNTETVFGHVMFVRNLAEPVYDTKTLVTRQKVTKEFLANQQIFNAVQAQLENIKAAESYFLSYFQKENAVNEELFKKVYWGDRLDFLNNSTLGLELATRLNNLGTFISLSFLPSISFVMRAMNKTGVLIASNEIKIQKDDPLFPQLKAAFGKGAKEAIRTLPDEFNFGLKTYKNFDSLECEEWAYDKNNGYSSKKVPFKDLSLKAKEHKVLYEKFPQTIGDHLYRLDYMSPVARNMAIATNFIIPTLFTVWYAYSAYNAIVDAKLKQDISNHLHTRMIAIASYINALKELHNLVKNNPVLSTLPGMEPLAELSNPNSALSADCKKLLELLDHITFTGEASVFSLTGRVLAAHRLMQKVKEELVPACAAAGRIDAYLSVAKLYQKFQSTPARFCFPKYIENSNNPILEALKFWNVFIDPYIVVTNSVELGINNPNNIILTGPNTGGKSTVIKGLLINVLIAQTLGIAPAEEFIITPFANLNCYLNITDDLTAGTSLFKAEVLRAKALINAVRNLGPQEFSFTIIDEVFSGTSPKEGEEAALMFAQELGAMSKSLCSIATHFPRLTDELSTDHFKNYKVTVYKDAHDNWVRPFKLEEGKSHLNIAMDLLREEGIFN